MELSVRSSPWSLREWPGTVSWQLENRRSVSVPSKSQQSGIQHPVKLKVTLLWLSCLSVGDHAHKHAHNLENTGCLLVNTTRLSSS